eukprot:3146181-Amphidinium_carterae.1
MVGKKSEIVTLATRMITLYKLVGDDWQWSAAFFVLASMLFTVCDMSRFKTKNPNSPSDVFTPRV